jgi:hypothetical protein
MFIPTNETIKPAIVMYFSDRPRATKLYGSIHTWGTFRVRNMKALFMGRDMTGVDIGPWSVVNVVCFDSMLEGATNFTSDISKWKTANARSMNKMIANMSYNGKIDNWHLRFLVSANGFAQNNPTFDRNLRAWQLYNILFAAHMFDGATAFTGGDNMFQGAHTLRDASYMFSNSGVTNVTIRLRDIETTAHMFADARHLKHVKLLTPGGGLIKLHNARRMFMNAKSFESTSIHVNPSDQCQAHGIFNGASLYCGYINNAFKIDDSSHHGTQWVDPIRGVVYSRRHATSHRLPWPPPRQLCIEGQRLAITQIVSNLNVALPDVTRVIMKFVGIAP